MNEENEAELRFIERFALLLTEAGMARMPSRVFACLLVSDGGRLTAAELAERLRVSPAAISGAVRYLAQVGLVHKGREPGARRDHYALADDVWYEAYATRSAMLKRWELALAEGIEAIDPDRPAAQRLRETREYFAFLAAELPQLMERWQEHKRGLR